MLSFSKFNESKSAPLYHGTSFKPLTFQNKGFWEGGAGSILLQGYIAPSNNGYVSASRDLHYMKQIHGWECYFILDQEKISNRQKIVPTDWHMGGSVPDDPTQEMGDRHPNYSKSESEEAIKGKVLISNATTLVVQKSFWDKFAGPMTTREKGYEEEISNGVNPGIFDNLLYSHRMKDVKKFKALLKKYSIKLEVKKYNHV
jgi:hypothetical protein